jgi:tRNA pseudouridine55 synthase
VQHHHRQINGWINLYKPLGITSAKAVAAVKRMLPKGTKIGHTGTLDPEAEGVLPLAIGEATKLVQFLMDARKTYRFKIQFGTKTDTADKVGKIVAATDIIPTKTQCYEVCERFTGEIEQTPPAFSALKINGVRAYSLARQNKEVNLASRKITIFRLECVKVDEKKATATYEVECSKGTYVRALAESISLSLQSLGFVLELARTKVGVFDSIDSLHLESLSLDNVLRVETILDDIPVLDINDAAAYKVRCGQELHVTDSTSHTDFNVDEVVDAVIWLRHNGRLLAIGKINQDCFESIRVFNL